MAKAEINNEIVLLRHTVRQARVCVINKLIKEARHLRNKHGTEKQLEKYKRKADRIIDEVRALKAIQDDDITKFGVMNERELTEILQDPASTNDIRIKARVACYKTLHRRLTQFKERYPDCKKYLTEERKKGSRLRANAARSRHSARESNSAAQNKTPKKQAVNPDRSTGSSQGKSSVSDGDEKVRETGAPTPGARETRNSRKRREKSTSDESVSSNEGKVQKLEKDDPASRGTDERPGTLEPRSVTSEGTVRRFTELLEEQETTGEDARTCAESSELAATVQAKTTVDDFFVTGDNETYKTDSGVSVQREKCHQHNTRSKVSQSNSRTKKQSGRDASFGKKHPAKQSSGAKSKKTINKGVADAEEAAANLHPSWLAKKKEQDIIRQGFQGKKIVFTDD